MPRQAVPFLNVRGTAKDESLPLLFGNGTAYGFEGDDTISDSSRKRCDLRQQQEMRVRAFWGMGNLKFAYIM